MNVDITHFEFVALEYIRDFREESLARLTMCIRQQLDATFNDEQGRKKWWKSPKHRDITYRLTGFVAEQLLRKGFVQFQYGPNDSLDGDEHARATGWHAVETLQSGQEPETVGFLGVQLSVTGAGEQAITRYKSAFERETEQE